MTISKNASKKLNSATLSHIYIPIDNKATHPNRSINLSEKQQYINPQ